MNWKIEMIFQIATLKQLVEMASYDGEYITQYKIPVQHNWVESNAHVKKLLTANQIDMFIRMCNRHDAELVEIVIMPNYGWEYSIKANGLCYPLSKEIEQLVKIINPEEFDVSDEIVTVIPSK